MKKLLRFLAVIGTLCSFTPKASGAESQENTKAKADVTVFANAEQIDDQKTFGDLTVGPSASVEMGDYELGCAGMFYNSGYIDGTHGDWMINKACLQLKNSTGKLQVGRMQLRPDFAAFLATPGTTGGINSWLCAGDARIFTGAHYTHTDTGLGLGLYSTDTRMTPTHWDSGLATWEHRFDKEWGVAAHLGVGDKGLQDAGLTVAYTPTDKTSVVAEGIFRNKIAHGILGVNHKLTDTLTAFAGLEVDKADQGKVNGWLETGVNYKIGKGFSAVAAFRQDIGGEHKPHGVIGIQYAGNFGILGQ